MGFAVIDNVVTSAGEYETFEQEFRQDHQEEVPVEVVVAPAPVASYDTLFPALGAPSIAFAVAKRTTRIETSVVTQVKCCFSIIYKFHSQLFKSSVFNLNFSCHLSTGLLCAI